MSKSSEMKSKIEKLLAKAEGTDNAAEAQAFSEAAERLMVKWGIDAAELEAAGEIKPEEIIEMRRTYKASYAEAMVPWAHSICSGFGNLRTLQANWRGERTFYVIGHKSDVELAMQLLDSLELQVMSAVKSWWRNAPEREWLDRMSGYKARRTFILSFGSAVGQRLREMRREETVEATPGAALVLVSKAEKVNTYLDENYSLGKARGGNMQSGYSGGAEGRAAGQRANLGGKSVGGSRAAVTR